VATAARRVVRRPGDEPLRTPWYAGLDPSLTKYGVVLYHPGTGAVEHTVIKTKPPAPMEAPGLRFQEIGRMLKTCFGDKVVDIVCMERAAYNASGAYTGGLVHATTAVALVEIFGGDAVAARPALVASTTLKKFATGKGNSPKQAMLLGVYKKWGFETDDDNLADAFALSRLAATLRSGSDTKYEDECVKVVLDKWQP